MREILFRGKDVKEKWHIGLLSHIGNAWYISNKAGIPTAFEVIPSTIGQYTGLTDKNGTKIFEGDIVKCSDIDDYYYPEEKTEFVGTIVFESGAFGIATKDTLLISLENWCENDNFVSFWELEWNEYIYNVEIIGNIHDNLELLK